MIAFEDGHNFCNKENGGYPTIETFDLVDAGLPSQDFFRSPRFPNCIIRRDRRFTVDRMTDKEIELLFANGQGIFDVLKKEYHVNVIDFYYSIGIDEDSGKRQLFTVAQEIRGKSFDRWAPQNTEDFLLFDEFMVAIIQATFESYTKNGLYWSEYKNEQVMCGEPTNGEGKRGIYIVDVEPLFREFKDRFNQKKCEQLLIYMDHIFSQMCSVEVRTQLGSKRQILRGARKELLKVVNSVNADDPNSRRLQEAIIRGMRNTEVIEE